MYISNSLSILPLISSIICIIVISHVLVKGEKTPKLFSLVSLLICAFLWSLGQFLEYSTDNINLILLYTKILHTGSIFLGVACFIFCLYYIESTFIKKYNRFIPFLLIIPTIILISLYTNELHWLFLKIEPLSTNNEYTRILGAFYWLESLNNYLFTAISIILMIISTLKCKGEHRKQRFILLLVLIVPSISALLFDIISAANDSVVIHFDIAPTSFSISLGLLVIATFKYSFLDILPITIKKIYYDMKDPIIVFNKHNKTLIYNTSFDNFFNNENRITNATDLIDFLNKYGNSECNDMAFHNAVIKKVNLPYSKEIQLVNIKTNISRTFDVNVSPIINTSGKETGQIITFYDITVYKELAAENERNRITLEIHDSIGYGLMNLIMLMKEAKTSLISNSSTMGEKMNSILGISEKMLNDLRFSVMELKSGKNPDIVDTIDSFADYVRCMGVTVKLRVMGQEQYEQFKNNVSSLPISDTLYKVCREAVTNSLRHGKATEITIIMKFSDNSVKMFIIDNGQGCMEIKMGIGLTGMETRVNGIGGVITYGSNDGKGFNIKVEVPLEVDGNDKCISC